MPIIGEWWAKTFSVIALILKKWNKTFHIVYKITGTAMIEIFPMCVHINIASFYVKVYNNSFVHFASKFQVSAKIKVTNKLPLSFIQLLTQWL